MLLAPNFLKLQKQVFLALCLVIGFSESIVAGSRGNQGNVDEAASQPTDAGSAGSASQPSLDEKISDDENIRLRRDLEAYSRTVDPAHVQIEERHRVMRKKIQERFADADTDNDGSISLEEATESLPQVARHFSRVDLNGDNVITFNELEAVYIHDMERGKVVVVDTEAQETPVEVTKRKGKQVTGGKSKEPLVNKRAL